MYYASNIKVNLSVNDL